MTAIVKFEGSNLRDGDVVVDLVFIRQGTSDDPSNTGVKPWKNFHKTELWTKDWLLDEFDFPCRVFDASYYPTSECWQERFPLLECSKIILHQLGKHRVGGLNHITFFFAWSLDALFLKQIIHTALLDQMELFSSIKGVAFFSSPQRMSNLTSFTGTVEFLAKHHNFCRGDDLKLHIPYFQGLNTSFHNIAQEHGIPCISFGIKNDPVLRGVELLYDLGLGQTYLCPMRTHYNITNFTTREELSYLRLINYLRGRYDDVMGEREKLRQEEALKSEREKTQIRKKTYSIAIRNKSLVLAFGEHSTEEDFARLKKDRRGEHPQVIQRFKAPSLFISLQEALLKISTFQSLSDEDEARVAKQRTGEREKQRRELQLRLLSDAIQEGELTIHIVGEYRHVSLSIMFICLTFNFEIKVKNKEVHIPEALEVHQIESVTCGYDMDVEMRHSRIVKRLITKWNELNQWGMKNNEESTQLIAELGRFASDPLKIAIVGKSNVGKSTFLNALLRNNVLPESHEACTGCVLEICYAETIEDENVELQFITKKELDVIVKRYKHEALAPDQAEYNELTGEREHWNPERSAVLKEKIAAHKQFLKELSTEYAGIVKEYPKLIQYWDQKTPIKQFISDTAVNTSKARSRLIKSAHLYLHNPLLRSVTLVDTPGIGEDKLKGRDHLTEQAVRAADVHGWIYLTVVMDMEKNFKEDLKLLSEWSPNGIVCVTKFDQLCNSNATGTQKPIHEKLSGKINALKDDVLQRQIPAVSSLSLFQMTTNFPSKSGAGMRRAEKMGQEVNRLIHAHVGEYLHTLLPEDLDDELSFDSDDISLARSCFDLCYRDWEDFKQLMCDLAVESSLLMVLMNLVYDLIDKRFVVKRFDQVLSDISTHLSRRLTILTDELQVTRADLDQIQSRDSQLQLGYTQTTLNEFEQQINSRVRVRQQLEEDCLSRETELEEIVMSLGNEICQKIVDRFSSKPNPKSPGMFDKLKRLLSKPPEHLSLYKELDKKLAADVNAYLTNTMLCVPTVETLITNIFDSIKHNILLQVDRASMSINCLREANPNIPLSDRIDLLDTTSKEATENFSAFLTEKARPNIKIIAANARAHLNNVHTMILGMVDKEISHLQSRLLNRRTKQQQEHVKVRQPADVLQVKLDKTTREFDQLQKMYAAVMHIALQNTIKSNKISQVIQSRNTLSKPEREYVSRIMKIYLDEPVDDDDQDEENITLLDTYLSIEAVIKHISSSYAKIFTVITVEEYFKLKPERVIVRNRRSLSVFMQAFHMMISQVSIDGSQFHTEKDLEELFSSIDCKILCEKDKLDAALNSP